MPMGASPPPSCRPARTGSLPESGAIQPSCRRATSPRAAGPPAAAALRAGPNGELPRIGSDPPPLLASDFPLALGPDGRLYFPSQGRTPVQIRTFSPGGETGILATLPATTAHGPQI